jgi:two-component system nitrogen regulation sensor histidine kinase NtrY
MIAAATPDMDDTGDGQGQSRFAVTPAIELMVLVVALAIAVGSYLVLGGDLSARLLSPGLVATMLVANLIPGIALLVLIGRRIAMRRAARSPVGGQGRLHVRLVALFSVIAAVPMILVAIVASLLFQYGVQFWYSDQARGMVFNATSIARSGYDETIRRWTNIAETAAGDLGPVIRDYSVDDPRVAQFFGQQIFYRGLSDGIIFNVTPRGEYRTLAIINPDAIDISREITPDIILRARRTNRAQVTIKKGRVDAVTPMPGVADTFLYTATSIDLGNLPEQLRRSEAIQASYNDLLTRARARQVQFNLALLAVSLLIVGIAVWIALQLADRLVQPVGELVDAARQVEAGNLTARVPDPRSRDEVGTLASAFNRMTARLEQQNTALVAANDQLDSRRALIEAVMAGVSAGVIATGEDRKIRIANASAARLLGGEGPLVGRSLGSVAPELDALVAEGGTEAIVQVGERTLAVRAARTEAGPILTFDDITQQQLDQRRAAWADVARRIAHEIKNPLTPIQLAAERLQRRYGGKVEEGDTTFARLTETIVRQVGDLRRMVDEFSSFARMPKPVFRPEPLVDTVRQAVFLHEVAHPAIRFTLNHDEPGPMLVCDRRQIGQAMTNIVKNAIEAIEAKGAGQGEVVVTVTGDAARLVTITVDDNGTGLPPERDRIVEPYMTTRARGTGLGLAIVKKIIEEHHGTIGFTDREGGGTRVTMSFDGAALATHDDGGTTEPAGLELVTLTRNRT